MKLFKSVVAGAAMFSLFNAAWAISLPDDLDPSKVPDKSTLKLLTEDLGAAMSYKAITPAEPLGITGFDIGFETTFTSLSNVDSWGNAIGTTSLDVLPLPKIHAHKGLPFGIDIGLAYAQIPGSNIKYLGGELRYSFVSGNVALPAIAVRGTYTTILGVDGVSFSTKGVEATVSKGFLFLTPYGGLGYQLADSEFETGVVGVGTLDESVSMFKWFAGLNINMGLLNIAGEVDQTGDAMSYSAKLGFRF